MQKASVLKSLHSNLAWRPSSKRWARLWGLAPIVLVLTSSIRKARQMDWHLFLRPEVFAPMLALGIPLLAVLFWGLKSVIRAMSGQPDDFDAWKREVEDLRTRVEELERAKQESDKAGYPR